MTTEGLPQNTFFVQCAHLFCFGTLPMVVPFQPTRRFQGPLPPRKCCKVAKPYNHFPSSVELSVPPENYHRYLPAGNVDSIQLHDPLSCTLVHFCECGLQSYITHPSLQVSESPLKCLFCIRLGGTHNLCCRLGPESPLRHLFCQSRS